LTRTGFIQVVHLRFLVGGFGTSYQLVDKTHFLVRSVFWFEAVMFNSKSFCGNVILKEA